MTRDEIVTAVVQMGILKTDGTRKAGSKEMIQQFYKENSPTKRAFAEYLNKAYGGHGCAVLDSRVPFKPTNFHYNNAGLQYWYRDQGLIIKLECLKWTTVAALVAAQIDSGKYLEKPSISNNLSAAVPSHSENSNKQKAHKNTDHDR